MASDNKFIELPASSMAQWVGLVVVVLGIMVAAKHLPLPKFLKP